MEILTIRPGDEAAWDSFLADRPGGLIYNSIPYRNLLADHLGCEPEYLSAVDGGEIRGVMPLMWTGDGEARVCNSLPFYGSHGGPVAADRDAGAALLAAWNERVTDPGTLAGTMVANPFLGEEAPPPVHTMTDARISQVTRLPDRAGTDEILGIVTSEVRSNIRKARHREVSVELDNGAMDEVCRIHLENMRAIGGPAKPSEFFEAIQRHLRAGEQFDTWIARRGGEVVAALLVLRFNGVAEYFASGTYPEHRSHNPHSLLILEAMVHAAEQGCRHWNWGGTWFDQDGVYYFKRKWGAIEGRYRYFTQLNDRSLLELEPQEVLDHFPGFYVYPFAEKLQALGASLPAGVAADSPPRVL